MVKTLQLKEKVIIKGIGYTVDQSRGRRCPYFLAHSKWSLNDEIFSVTPGLRRGKKYDYVEFIVGKENLDRTGDFPFVKTLEALTKLVKALKEFENTESTV